MGQWRGPPTGGGTKNPFACAVVVEVGMAVTSDFEIPKHLVALLIRNCPCPYCYSRSVLGDARRVGDRCRLGTCLLRRTWLGRGRLGGGWTLRRVVRGFDCRGARRVGDRCRLGTCLLRRTRVGRSRLDGGGTLRGTLRRVVRGFDCRGARRVGDRCRLSTCLLRRTRVGRSRLDGGGTLRQVVRGFGCRGARRVGDRRGLSTCLLRRTWLGRSRLDGGGPLRRVVRGFDCRGSGLPIRRRHQSRFRNDSLAPHPRGWRNRCCRRHVVCVTRAGGFCLTRDWGGIALRVRKDGADDFVIKETIVDRGSFKRCFTVIKL